MNMAAKHGGRLLFVAFGYWVVFAATPTRADVILSVDFEAPFPVSTPAGSGTYVVVQGTAAMSNFQVQGGTDGTGLDTLTAGIDTNGFGGGQALFANWDYSQAKIYTWNQYTFYGQPGLAVPVPLNTVQVSADVFVSGHEDDTKPLSLVYQEYNTTNLSTYNFTPTNNAWTHISFTLNQGVVAGTIDLTQPFNFQLVHDNSGFGFDANNIVRLDNVLVQTITPVVVAGDYNGNGIVDAADYTIWRDTLGSTTDLRVNGDTTGASATVIDQADYTFWKSHFGATSGAGSGLGGCGCARAGECSTWNRRTADFVRLPPVF